MGKIYWISAESEARMGRTAKTIFPLLWNQDIGNTTIFFGDYFKEQTENDVSNYMDNLAILAYNAFGQDHNHEDYVESATLLNSDDNPALQKIVKKFKKVNIAIPDISELTNRLNNLFDDNTEDILIMINPLILEGDNVLAASGYPTLSMVLYNYIVNDLGAKCLIHSDHSLVYMIEDSWKKTYNQLYPDNLLPEGFKMLIQGTHCECEDGLTLNNILKEYNVPKEKVMQLRKKN